jgi:hypothetical protein
VGPRAGLDAVVRYLGSTFFAADFRKMKAMLRNASDVGIYILSQVLINSDGKLCNNDSSTWNSLTRSDRDQIELRPPTFIETPSTKFNRKPKVL